MLVLLDEVNHPLLFCPNCDILVTGQELNRIHHDTAMRAKGEERRLKRLLEEEAVLSMEMVFEAYRRPSEMVTVFK